MAWYRLAGSMEFPEPRNRSMKITYWAKIRERRLLFQAVWNAILARMQGAGQTWNGLVLNCSVYFWQRFSFHLQSDSWNDNSRLDKDGCSFVEDVRVRRSTILVTLLVSEEHRVRRSQPRFDWPRIIWSILHLGDWQKIELRQILSPPPLSQTSQISVSCCNFRPIMRITTHWFSGLSLHLFLSCIAIRECLGDVATVRPWAPDASHTYLHSSIRSLRWISRSLLEFCADVGRCLNA